MEKEDGIKADKGKIRWGLMPSYCLERIAEVFTYGAIKYEDDNWKYVEKERYVDALFRHIHAWMQGEKNDKESGLHHLAHAGANILFLLWKEREEEKKPYKPAPTVTGYLKRGEGV